MHGTPEAFAVKVITTIGAREQYTMDDMKLPFNHYKTKGNWHKRFPSKKELFRRGL